MQEPCPLQLLLPGDVPLRVKGGGAWNLLGVSCVHGTLGRTTLLGIFCAGGKASRPEAPPDPRSQDERIKIGPVRN